MAWVGLFFFFFHDFIQQTPKMQGLILYVFHLERFFFLGKKKKKNKTIALNTSMFTLEVAIGKEQYAQGA